jgi:ABC-type hemin transport system ATPase subunit
MFCDKILLLSQGELVGFEEPGKILRAESIKQYFDANVVILKHPQTSSPLVVSQLDNLSN